MESSSSAVFRRQLNHELAFADEAKGVWITNAQGQCFLDGSGGPLVVNVGHGREEIARAMADQVMRCDYVHPTMFTGQPVETLARRLADNPARPVR